jgi:hypothetical protein
MKFFGRKIRLVAGSLLAAAPGFAATFVEPALPVSPSAPAAFLTAGPAALGAGPAAPALIPTFGGAALTAPAAPLVAPASEPAALAAEIHAQALALPSAAPLAAFAERSGISIAVTPFAGKKLMGLDADNLAQYSAGDRRVYVNWDYVGGDRRALEDAGIPAAEARTLTALAAAPVYAHELRHAELREAYGSDFPGLAEEEILTHLDQAAVLAEILRSRPSFAARIPLLEKLFLYPHSRRLVDLRAEGFGPLADHVLRRYRGISPSLDDPAKNAADARAALERLEADPASAPPGWIEKARANVAFWENPDEVRRLTAFLQERINSAYAAVRR